MLTRRTFLKCFALALVAGAGMPALFTRGAAAATEEKARAAASGRRVLIVIQLKGGNDGLNSIVPYSDGHYYDLRGDLAVPEGQVIAFSNELGFHPAMANIKRFWDQGKFAIVQGVGYPAPSYSHFSSMDYWREARVGRKGSDGWLGRYLDGLDGPTIGPVPAMNVGRRRAPELLSHKVSAATVSSLRDYQFKTDRRFKQISDVRFEALRNLYHNGTLESGEVQLFARTFQAAVDSSLAVQRAHASYTPLADYPDSRLAQDLLLLAEAVHFNQDLKVGHVAIGGFDTHANQAAVHAGLLRQFSDAVGAFMDDIEAHGHAEEVAVMTWSEFGRRPRSNASGGTDHGSAAPMFLVGHPVTGGLYGESPGLNRLDDKGNLKFTTDFRSVYATVLDQWLGAPADDILAGQFDRLPLFRSK